MKRKQKRWLFLCCFSFFLLCPGNVKAEYFTHHTDWTYYCMQARDVQLTDSERKKWIAEGTLSDNLVERSELLVNRFHASDSKEYWTEYQGSYYVDTSQLEANQVSDGEGSGDIQVTFYLDEKDKEWNYIVVTVKIIAEESAYLNDGGKNTQEHPSPDESGEWREGKSESPRPFVMWIFFGITALICYGINLYSDYKVLKRYKQKKVEMEKGKMIWN